MDYKYLGNSALKVSRLCLGSMMFGGPTTDNESREIIESAFDHGINFIDTADIYNAGRSEEVVGNSVRSARDKWVIATKFVNALDKGPNLGGYSRKWVIQAVDSSLKRLNTDYIDILYFHRAIFDAPLEEPVRAIADLIRAGKLRYFGVSNFRGWRIAQICQIADEIGIDRPVASQPLYNIVNRTAESEQIPAAAFYGLGVVSYSPLARSVLTGKYTIGQPPAEDTRAGRGDKRIAETEWRKESLLIASRVANYAEKKGASASIFALSWVLNNSFVTSTICGPRTKEQWEHYLKALEYEFSSEDEAFVDSLVSPGHSSTLGYNDPSHPIEGRRIAF